jgi:hypothetical protein
MHSLFDRRNLPLNYQNFSKHYKGGVIEPSMQLAFGHNAEITLKKNFGHYR